VLDDEDILQNTTNSTMVADTIELTLTEGPSAGNEDVPKMIAKTMDASEPLNDPATPQKRVQIIAIMIALCVCASLLDLYISHLLIPYC
jgi:hypothetical protein